MKGYLKILSTIIITGTCLLSSVVIACHPEPKTLKITSLYNLTFGLPAFHKSSAINWDAHPLAKARRPYTNFFNLLNQQDDFKRTSHGQKYYKYSIEVWKKLKTVLNEIPNSKNEPLIGDGLQLAKSLESYSNFAVSPSYVSNYTRILNSKLPADSNRPGHEWWTTFAYHGQDWRIIFKNLFTVLGGDNDYLATTTTYTKYFKIYLSLVNSFGYAKTKNDFKFLVQVISLYKILFGLLSPRAVARIADQITLEKPKHPNQDARTESLYDATDQRIKTSMFFYSNKFHLLSNASKAYREGWWSTYKASSALVHEYGHALDFLLTWVPGCLSEQKYSARRYLDWKPVPDNYRIATLSPSPADYFVSVTGQEVWQELTWHIKPVDPRLKVKKFYQTFSSYFNTIITYSIVRSNYGRTFGYDLNNMFNPEIQAEAFAQWILTPPSLRTQGWRILDHVFGGLDKTSFSNTFAGHNNLNAYS